MYHIIKLGTTNYFGVAANPIDLNRAITDGPNMPNVPKLVPL